MQDEKTVSCNSMKKYGYVKSNIYTLKSENDLFPRLSYCQMEENSGYDGNMEKLIGYINYSPVSEIIMFSAYGTSGSFGNGQYITFTNFHAEHGSNFDLSSGTFTTSADGVYEFDFHLPYDIFGSSNYEVKVAAELNGAKVAESWAHINSGSDLYSSINYGWSLDLHQGDSIRLRVYSANSGKIFANSYSYIAFNGKYVRPLSK